MESLLSSCPRARLKELVKDGKHCEGLTRDAETALWALQQLTLELRVVDGGCLGMLQRLCLGACSILRVGTRSIDAEVSLHLRSSLRRL